MSPSIFRFTEDENYLFVLKFLVRIETGSSNNFETVNLSSFAS